jgi:hypothetical protein
VSLTLIWLTLVTLTVLCVTTGTVQVIPAGSPLFSLAWNSRHKVLAAGGHSVLHVFKLDSGDALRLRQARQAIASAGGATGGGGRGAVPGAAAAASKAASDADRLQLLKRLCPPCKGWKYGRSFSPLGARSRSPAKVSGSSAVTPPPPAAQVDGAPHAIVLNAPSTSPCCRRPSTNVIQQSSCSSQMLLLLIVYCPFPLDRIPWSRMVPEASWRHLRTCPPAQT